MRRPDISARLRRLTGVAATAGVLVLGTGVSWAAMVAVGRTERDSAGEVMDRRAQDVDRTITNEIRQFYDTLDDLSRAVGSQSELTADDYQVLTAGLDATRLPGAGGVAFVAAATDDEVAALQERWRAAGDPALRLQPVGTGLEHMFAIFDRPLDGGPAIGGRDVSQAAYSAEALRAARETDQFVVSEPYVLVRDQGAPAKQQLSFTFAVPVHEYHGARKGAFEGWISVGVRGGDFLDRTLRNASGYGLRAQLVAGPGAPVATVPHNAALPANPLNRTISVTAGRRQWLVTVGPTKEALDTAGHLLTQLTLLGGVVVTLLMTALVGNLAFARNRALTRVDEATAALRKLAFHDPLTGLANRTLFYDRIQTAATGPFAALFIDLDGFKQVNDEFGHAGGDYLLRTVAGRLRECTRPGDTVARLGGDEFAVLIADLGDVADARRCAERIVRSVGEPIVRAGVAMRIGASVGIAVGTAGDDIDEVLRRADEAMYRAKSLGKGRFVLADEVSI